MTILELIILAIGLSMDAFVVAICKGLTQRKLNYKISIKIALYFGLFQGIMPLLGYLLGTLFKNIIISIDHWITFGLLSFIGLNFIKDANEEENLNDKLDIKTMILLSIATSIDALAVGITFSILKINILVAITLITLITTILSYIGVIIGNKIGNKLNKPARILGGINLIILGIKILIEHFK